MKSAPEVTNVVAACNTEGRQERLDGMLQQLELCEKALQVGGRSCWGQGRPEGPDNMVPMLGLKAAGTQPLPTAAVSPTLPQDYLETKRRAFPRFYFVAPADLLDILAKAGCWLAGCWFAGLSLMHGTL